MLVIRTIRMGLVRADENHITRCDLVAAALRLDPTQAAGADDQDCSTRAVGTGDPVSPRGGILACIRDEQTDKQRVSSSRGGDGCRQNDMMLSGKSFISVADNHNWKIVQFFPAFVHGKIIAYRGEARKLKTETPRAIKMARPQRFYHKLFKNS